MISAELESQAEIPPKIKMIRCQFLTLQHQPCAQAPSQAPQKRPHPISSMRSLPGLPRGLEIKGVCPPPSRV